MGGKVCQPSVDAALVYSLFVVAVSCQVIETRRDGLAVPESGDESVSDLCEGRGRLLVPVRTRRTRTSSVQRRE